jgi:hypothetical protein
MKDIERLKAAWYRFKHYRATVLFTMKLIKYKTLWKSQPGRGMDDIDTNMMSNIIEIQIFGIFYIR